jgi:hypothetical protein
MPGRGRPGAAAPGGRVNFASMSGRGGTIGRAAGWPARFGLAGGRSGLPPPTGDPGTIVAAGGAAGRGIGRAGPGMLGAAPGLKICPGDGVCPEDGAGRGAPGAVSVRASTGAEGNGCLGPERICPGLGAGGVGRAGIGIPRGAIGGESGGPEASGGRKGADRGAGAGVSGAASRAAGRVSGVASIFAAGVRAGSAAGTGSVTVTGVLAGSGPAVCGAPFASPVKRRFTSSATGSSIELEWVFFSVTPSSGSISRITLGFTSSSRASSLIRIFVILCAPPSNVDTGVVEIKSAPYREPPRLPGTPQCLS